MITEMIIKIIFGVLVAVALILPGISVSYILLVFSCYDSIILAISNLDLFFLFKIGIFIAFLRFIAI